MSMKVILTEKVPTLGNIGEIVKVSEGYARNYLLPRKCAVVADEKNTKALQNQKKALAKKIEAEKKAATDLKAKVEGITIELIKRVGANGKLFGAVTNAELAKILSDRGVEVERRLIAIEVPIKQIGSFDVKVKFFPEVEAKFKVKVAMDPAQIEENKKLQEEAKKAKEAKAAADKAAAEKAAADAAAKKDAVEE